MVATQIFLIFTRKIGEDEPILTSIFFKGVETTKQFFFARNAVLFGLGYSHFDAVMWSVLASACEKGRSWEMALHVFGALATQKGLRPLKFNSSPLKSHLPKRKGSSSNHPFSGAMLNFGGVQICLENF